MSVAHDKIQELAYRLWQDDGAPAGRDMDYWLQAEAALHATVIAAAKPKTVKAAAKKAPAAPKAAAAAKPKAPAKPKTTKAPAKAKV